MFEGHFGTAAADFRGVFGRQRVIQENVIAIDMCFDSVPLGHTRLEAAVHCLHLV